MLNILTSGAIAMTITLLGTRFLITFLTRKAYGQLVRDDGPTEHHVKRGTPTMGGLIIVIAVLAAYALVHLIFWTPVSASGLLALYLFASLGMVGFIDDWTKIRKARSLGLNARAKLALQGFIGLDDVGVIHKITNLISGELKFNISAMTIEAKEGIFEGNVKIFVHDKEELDELVNRLVSMSGIERVDRYDTE